MRIRVFARGANPAVDRPILKKSRSYVDEQVERGRAVYVDAADPAKGIICRELLYFGPPRPKFKKARPTKSKLRLPAREAGGAYFQQPSDPAWQELHARAGRCLQIRSWITLKGWSEQFKNISA